MTVTLVPKEGLRAVWPIVEPMFKRVLDRTPGRFLPVDILVEILKEQRSLWVYYDDETKNIEATFTTKIYDVPLGKICCFEWGAGKNVEEWVHESLDLIEQYARENGCTRLEGHGRRGWKDWLFEHGWKELSTSFEKELT